MILALVKDDSPPPARKAMRIKDTHRKGTINTHAPVTPVVAERLCLLRSSLSWFNLSPCVSPLSWLRVMGGS